MKRAFVATGATLDIGTSRPFAAPQNLSPIGLTTDKGWRRASIDTQRLTQSGQRPMSQHHRLIALGHLSKCQPKPLLWLDQSFWGCMERREFITL